MNTLTLTALRQNIFQVADQVLATGEPVVIERNGRRLVLAAAQPKIDWEHLPRRQAIVGDPEDLVEWSGWDESQWGEPALLAEADAERAKP